ncbi:XRE family transcriptional regulator [Jiella endophytica]|nr:LexA family transcriptional regulator [Jiella endophytica]
MADQNQAAEITGYSVDTLTNWKFGRSRPDFFALAELCRAANVSVDWLATGKGSESTRDSSAISSHGPGRTQQEQNGPPMLQIVDTEDLQEGAFVLIPRMEARASAGSGLIAQSENVDAFVAFQDAYLRTMGVNPRFARILPVSGDSMHPTLTDQDQVLIDTSIDHVVDNALYAVVYNESVLVKRVQLMRDGSVILSSDNKAAGYLDERVEPHELSNLHIVGRVKAHLRYM